MKNIIIDLETGGWDPSLCPILEIGARVEIDGDTVKDFNIHMLPFDDDPEPTEEALEVIKLTKEDVYDKEKRVPPQTAFIQFEDFLSKYVDRYDSHDKFYFIGYNSRVFDEPIMRRFFNRNDNNYYGSWFWNPSLDVMSLASWAIRTYRPKLKNFKLGTIAKYFGIEVDEKQLHGAMYDVELTQQITRKLTQS